jgi:hypothetical protein
MCKNWSQCVPALLLLLFLFEAFKCPAQEFRAVLTGQITDPVGAAITGARAAAVNVASGTSYSGKTSDRGVHFIFYVWPGDYTATAEASCFKTIVQGKVEPPASQRPAPPSAAPSSTHANCRAFLSAVARYTC